MCVCVAHQNFKGMANSINKSQSRIHTVMLSLAMFQACFPFYIHPETKKGRCDKCIFEGVLEANWLYAVKLKMLSQMSIHPTYVPSHLGYSDIHVILPKTHAIMQMIHAIHASYTSIHVSIISA